MHADENAKEEIRSRLDIADVVGRYVALKQSGRNMKGLCPFHKEKTPSFLVHSEKGIFHCFGCGKGGDVFAFLMEVEGVGFSDALRIAAEEAGVELQAGSPRREEAQGPGKTELFKANKLADDFFYAQMRRSQKAIDYFKGRGLSAETVRDFHLGYAPAGWTDLVNFAEKHGVDNDLLIAAGLAVGKSGGQRPYDRFRDRIIFPIRDASGRTIAFGGRGMTPDAQPKYLNSPENPIYHKSRVLYGLDRARAAIKERNQVLVVEGYMDLISLYSHGIENCIATSGTALTVDHGHMLRRFTGRVVLVFDGDSAGVSAAERAVYTLAPLGLEVRVLILPGDEDPDSYIRVHGPEVLLSEIERAQEGFDFILRRAIEKHGISSPQGKSEILKVVTPFLRAVTEPIILAEYLKRSAERLGLREELVRKVLQTHGNGGEERISEGQEQQKSKIHRFLQTNEGNLIRLLLARPELIETAMERISPETFTDSFSRNLYCILIDSYGSDATLSTLTERVQNENARQVITEAILKPGPTEGAEADLHLTIRRLQRKFYKAEMRGILERLRSQEDPGEKRKLLERQKKIALSLQELDA